MAEMRNLKDRLIYALGGLTEGDALRSKVLIDRMVEENERLRKELAETKKDLEKARKTRQCRSKKGTGKKCPKIYVQTVRCCQRGRDDGE